MALQSQDILQQLIDTQENLPKLQMSDLALTLTDYAGWDFIYTKKQAEIVTGDPYSFVVNFDFKDNFQWVDLTTPDPNITMKDTGKKVTVQMRKCQAFAQFNEVQAAQNSDEHQLQDYVQRQNDDAVKSFVENINTAFWGLTATTDVTTMLGIRNALVPNPSPGAVEGFYGSVPTGYTTVYGLTPSDYPLTPGATQYKWANYTGEYTTVDRADLITKVRKAMDRTRFTSPGGVSSRELSAAAQRFGFYLRYDLLYSLENLAQDQNDALGPDIDPMNGKARFRGVAFTPVDYLEDQADSTLYGIDWSTWKIYFLKGFTYRREAPEKVAGYSGWMQTRHVLATTGPVCVNRRRNFQIAAA